MTRAAQREGRDDAPLAQLLLKRFKWMERALLDELAASGWPELTAAQSMVMARLPDEGARPSRLARELGVTRQSLHQTINDLRSAGLVETVGDPDDGRSQIVRLTRYGRENVAAALKAFRRIEGELARRIGAGEVANLRRALDADWGAPG